MYNVYLTIFLVIVLYNAFIKYIKHHVFVLGKKFLSLIKLTIYLMPLAQSYKTGLVVDLLHRSRNIQL